MLRLFLFTQARDIAILRTHGLKTIEAVCFFYRGPTNDASGST